MEIHVNNRRRRRHGEPRLLEKQIRPEVIERCLQFIDIIINQIIYQENIYPSNLFRPRQMYHSLVYQCIDRDISSYITLCVASLRDLFSQQLSDMISINIIRNFQIPIILRRYLIELHTIQDPCLRAIYDNTKQLMNQLDQIFAQCIQTIKQIQPLENNNYNKGWTFQLRSCSDGRNSKGTTIGEILRKKPIYKEFILMNQQSDILSNGKQSMISSIKSLHTERLKLQFMCEDDKYEEEKFQQWNQYVLENISIDEQDTEYETDSDIDDQQECSGDVAISSMSSKKTQKSELWPLTTTNDPPICTLDDPDINVNDIEQKSKDKKRRRLDKTINLDSGELIDRYHLTQKSNRDNSDAHQYSSDEEDQPPSPYSPDHVWQDEEDEDEEDF
ncbi:unnamed protein product [Adineta steineri]|uniref:HORMA domain-containing protein n=3 Tax=Adineta steineri TaxID=433720 RepID=A0A819XZ78_9BILA|nr:unnamed protein product [Adineta steineri]CAF4149475.1 unnamed protein product [Adineta steineri]